MTSSSLHLAIDLDNTLVDTLTTCLGCFNRLTGQRFTRDDCTMYTFFELYGWKLEEYLEVYARHGNEIHGEARPYPGAVEILRELARHHRLTVVTARPMTYATLSIDWLKRHGVPYDAISFNPDKLATCRAMNIDLLIDDTPHYAEAFSRQGHEMMLMDHPYNRYIDHPGIYRVSDWSGIRAELAQRQPLTEVAS